ncbi:uncharacterized protein AMSG_02824 [Thecamonas trahens ATCC 50062]|uniref:Uncharacterized protein n=1 Tax=Thecamonas trahens ATCC 50062 TaxID=461836 RepID=A0A0L0D262_THETB|nr:hypothetical protein AMSG_02824 [Thecamonas trahens ATCC 50062]KNC46372.1 hypothetical protein AMSG_02824 [Thecamonas trahens ATCC 50062]|eukprot:XP_013760665.1 hypothetical protein AMSG_02824 [Thecamonas trahens ATCC 50062]
MERGEARRYLWRELSPLDLQALGRAPVVDALHLAGMLRIPTKKALTDSWTAATLEYLASVLVFAREEQLTAPQTSVVFALVRELHSRATRDAAPLADVVALAKSVLAAHARRAPGLPTTPATPDAAISDDDAVDGDDASDANDGNAPAAAELFSLSEIKNIMAFLSSTLFQHYKLFQLAASTPQPQVITSEDVLVEVPARPPPLADAVLRDEFVKSQARKLEDLNTMVEAASRGQALQAQLESYLEKARPLLAALTVSHSTAQLQALLEANVAEFCALYKAGVSEAMAAREAALLAKLAELPVAAPSHRSHKSSRAMSPTPGAAAAAAAATADDAAPTKDRKSSSKRKNKSRQ